MNTADVRSVRELAPESQSGAHWTTEIADATRRGPGAERQGTHLPTIDRKHPQRLSG